MIRFLFDRGELAEESREEEKISYARGHQPISLSRNGKERNYFFQDEMGSTMILLDHNHEIQNPVGHIPCLFQDVSKGIITTVMMPLGTS